MPEATQPESEKPQPTISKVGDLPLDVVLTGNDSVLSNSLRRVLEQMGRPGENYAAHSSSSS